MGGLFTGLLLHACVLLQIQATKRAQSSVSHIIIPPWIHYYSEVLRLYTNSGGYLREHYASRRLRSSRSRRLLSYIGYDGVRLTSQNCLYGPIFHPWVIAMWTMVWWYRLGLTHDLSTRVLWQPPVLSRYPVSRDISGESTRMDEGSENLVCPSPWDFKRFLTCRKILHVTSGFTSHPKGRCAADFYRP
jgi:hypothetical protein